MTNPNPSPRPAGQPTGGNNGGTGLAPNIASLLCYICMPIIAIIFLVIEKENRDVKFHAWQAIFFTIALFAISIALFILSFILTLIPYLGPILTTILYIIFIGAFLVIWILLLVKAYQGERWQIPVIGEYAAKQANA